MPAILANAASFLQNSDYPFDKVIFIKTGSYILSGNSGNIVTTIPHGLPFTPLMGGNWSFTSDFLVEYEFGSGTFPPSNPGYIYDTVANVYSDATNVYINADHAPAAAETLYYRVFGLAPDTDSSSLTSVANQGDSFVLNTDYNNTKIFLDSHVDLPATTGVSVNVAIEHQIGYTPQTLGWITSSGFIHPVGSTNSFVSQTLMSSNSGFVNFTIKTFTPAQRAYFRVYLDN